MVLDHVIIGGRRRENLEIGIVADRPEQLPISFPTVFYSIDNNLSFAVADFVQYSVIAASDAIPFLISKFLNTERSRVIQELCNARTDAPDFTCG